eukprot:scaffold1954_cov268-Pinguiococcus_pyrenoidosus.AAC.93
MSLTRAFGGCAGTENECEGAIYGPRSHQRGRSGRSRDQNRRWRPSCPVTDLQEDVGVTRFARPGPEQPPASESKNQDIMNAIPVLEAALTLVPGQEDETISDALRESETEAQEAPQRRGTDVDRRRAEDEAKEDPAANERKEAPTEAEGKD